MRKIKNFLGKLILYAFAISVFWVLLLKFIPVYFTPLMAVRTIDNIISGNEPEFSHQWRSLEKISPNLQRAVIASEDSRFLEHSGFDFEAMQKAYASNKKGKKIKGGSTISQQTAKNVFLWPGRSYIRKIFEAYFTVLIEIIWGKERIMEVYLNSIETGTNVYGAQAAAHHWFLADASEISPAQAAAIAAILPNPRKYKATNSSAYIQKRKSRIQKHMRYVEVPRYE
jgi:monofunctional glycosyltransferase